jgi:hypothetical protein
MTDYRWTLRITATDADAAHVVTRRHRFAVGRPVDFDADYPQVTALEYALGALGGEIVNGLRIFAKRRRIAIHEIEAVVNGELENPLTYLEVVGEPGHPGLSRVSVKVYVASAHDEQTLKKLWAETRERLPLVRTFGEAVGLTVEFRPTDR